MRSANELQSWHRFISFSRTLACLFVVVITSAALGQDGWIGRKFMPKEGCAIKIGTQEIPAKGVALPYIVSQVSGDWLWVGDGWVQKSRVVSLDGAAGYYSEYLRTHPNSVWAYNLRGWTRYENKDYDNAIADYDAAIRLDPRDAMGYNSLAWLLATCPAEGKRDGKRAVAMARQACTLSNWKDPYLIDTLAAAYAESGNFDEAVSWQTKAAKMLAFDVEFRKAADERLALYRERQPYREPAKEPDRFGDPDK